MAGVAPILLSLLEIPSALSLLGFSVCPGDTPCLTSGPSGSSRKGVGTMTAKQVIVYSQPG